MEDSLKRQERERERERGREGGEREKNQVRHRVDKLEEGCEPAKQTRAQKTQWSAAHGRLQRL